jgi:hypothetical protein
MPNTNPSGKKQLSQRLVSDEGRYLQNDSMGDLHKKMQDLIKQTIFLPEHNPKNKKSKTQPPPQ